MEIKKISLEEFNLRKRSILPPAYKDSTIVESKAESNAETNESVESKAESNAETNESKSVENCSEVPKEDPVESSIKRLKEAINNYNNKEEIFK